MQQDTALNARATDIDTTENVINAVDNVDLQSYGKILGNSITELPKDLYIPPDALEIFLEAFEGPLDLLLYLIKRQNVDILEIPIAEITEQYMEYVELMRGLRLELAAEYLVMAATLAEIKSRLLLPRPEVIDEEDDPRADLVRRLQEYERFKKATEEVNALPRLERDIFLLNVRTPDLKIDRPLPTVALQELLLAFKAVMHRVDMRADHQILREPLSIRARMMEILERLQQHKFLNFAQLFTIDEGRAGVVVAFIAILELLRESLINMVQTKPLAPIHIRSAS